MESAGAVATGQGSPVKGSSSSTPKKGARTNSSPTAELADNKAKRTGQVDASAHAEQQFNSDGNSSPAGSVHNCEASSVREPRRTRKGGLSQELRERSVPEQRVRFCRHVV